GRAAPCGPPPVGPSELPFPRFFPGPRGPRASRAAAAPHGSRRSRRGQACRPDVPPPLEELHECWHRQDDERWHRQDRPAERAHRDLPHPPPPPHPPPRPLASPARP